MRIAFGAACAGRGRCTLRVMNDWWWYLARSSGIVATVLALASLTFGLLFSSRATGKRLRPAWWLDLHNWLGGLAFAFTVVHVLAVFADSDLGIGVEQILVPGTASSTTTAITFGVIATYLMAVVTVPSIARIRRRLPRKAWHTVRLLAVPMVVLSILHGYQTGTDALTGVFQLGLILLVALAVYPLGIRLTEAATRRFTGRSAT